MTQDQEIQEVIKKNLPAHVGDVLKTRLEQADRDSEKVKSQSEVILSRDTTIRGLEKVIEDYKKLDERNSGIEARELSIYNKEREMKIKELEYQIEAEKDKTKFSKEVALGLVRNTEFRRTLYDRHDEPYKDQYGNTQYHNKTQNSDEVKTTN